MAVDTRLVANGATQMDISQTIEEVLIGGDLSKLSAADRVSYYHAVCRSLGLNPLTKPFAYISLNGKTVLYALRDCTDQLRKINHVNITGLVREKIDDVYVVTASATMPDGRQDESIGAVSIGGLKGEALANAFMKAETKSKRRVTLSIVGLGWLDETETETIPSAQLARVNTETGEIASFDQTFPANTTTLAPKPASPPIMPTVTGKRQPSRPELNAGYDQRVDAAILLQVPYKARLDDWSDSYLVEEGQGLRNRIRVAEEAGAKTAQQT
jgi:hypothetical protein